MTRPLARSCRAAFAAPLVLAVAALCARPGHAQDGGSLYRAGVEAYGRGDYDVACRQFAESHRVEARSAPLYMLGRCEERRGRLATAMGHFEQVLALPGVDAATRDHAQRELDSLRGRVPKLVVAVAPDAPAGMKATLDGAPIALGAPVPVDPGQHQLEITAPGSAPQRNLVDAIEAQTVTVTAAPRPAFGGHQPPPAAAARPATGPPVAAPPDASGSHTMRTAGFVAGGVGIAALGVAAVTGILVLDRSSTFDDPASSASEREDARSAGETLIAVNWVGWALGLSGVGLGAALLIASAGGDGSGARPSARVSLTPGGAVAHGRF
jgi:hypothetical protein